MKINSNLTQITKTHINNYKIKQNTNKNNIAMIILIIPNIKRQQKQ